MDIKQMLAMAIEAGASDVHINIEMPPIMRINTELMMMDLPEVSNDDAGKMILELIGEDKFKKFLEKRDWDFSTMIDDGSRFRVNAHFQKESFALSFRAISNHIPDIEELHLPEVVTELTDLPRGLVVVTGHTGSGKSTTLASMVDVINQKNRKRIITLEDPVEYLMENKSCMIEQREMGSDCTSFSSGLRHALRQDPDIILVGEMRDLETTSSTITAAETGHLVFSTLHTVNASQTVERIIDIYPASQQNQIRAMLSNTLQAVISQTLFRRVDQPGMVPCCEILLCTSAVRNCIRENRIFEIPNIIETSRRLGMQTMDHSIQQNYMKGFLDREEAIIRASNPGKMEKLLPATPQPQVAEQA
ncbi:MAG: type IV pili twitching motility protein PilT [Planctomycetales bacterium 4572_13]|nr:MAG: type IV pili twitching motility protein PilT [Planctomycetales bacterium 4572_13]